MEFEAIVRRVQCEFVEMPGLQLTPAQAFDRATDVILNDGSVEELEKKVGSLWRKWTTEPSLSP